MHADRPFDLFSGQHLLILCLTALVGIAFVMVMKIFAKSPRLRAVERGFAALIIVQLTLERIWYYFVADYTLAELLPFQLCNASIILACVLLLTHNRMAYQVVYYWGFAGATMGMFMPEVEYPWPHPLFVSYFFSHAYIVYAVAYMTAVRGYRPHARHLPRVFLITNGYMLFCAGINLLLGTNFLFLCQKPTGTGLMDYLGPWPMYLIGLELIGAILMMTVYAPWAVTDFIRKKRERKTYAVICEPHEQTESIG